MKVTYIEQPLFDIGRDLIRTTVSLSIQQIVVKLPSHCQKWTAEYRGGMQQN